MDKKTKVDQLKDMLAAKKEAEKNREQTEQVGMDEMAAQIKAAEDEAGVHYDKLLRVMAEFDNFKKRMDKEHLEQIKFSNQCLISDILPVLDDLDRVLDHVPGGASPEVVAIADGVRLIQNHLMNALSRYGLAALESSVGQPFNPGIHEAVAHVENAEHPENAVINEHRRGWKLHDRLIRAAMVTVAKAVGVKK